MNKLISIFMAMIIAFSMPACQSLQNMTPEQRQQNIENVAIPAMASTAYIICAAVFEKSGSLSDKREKAEIVYNVAKAIEELANGEIPEPKDFTSKFKNKLPNKDHWNEMARLLGILYADFYINKVGANPNTKLIAQALIKIAEGCRLAAEDALTIE